jgi:hypothetical protein
VACAGIVIVPGAGAQESKQHQRGAEQDGQPDTRGRGDNHVNRQRTATGAQIGKCGDHREHGDYGHPPHDTAISRPRRGGTDGIGQSGAAVAHHADVAGRERIIKRDDRAPDLADCGGAAPDQRGDLDKDAAGEHCQGGPVNDDTDRGQ